MTVQVLVYHRFLPSTEMIAHIHVEQQTYSKLSTIVISKGAIPHMRCGSRKFVVQKWCGSSDSKNRTHQNVNNLHGSFAEFFLPLHGADRKFCNTTVCHCRCHEKGIMPSYFLGP